MAEKRKHVVFAEEEDQPTAGPSRLHPNGVHPDRQALVPNGGAASGSTEAQEKQKKQKTEAQHRYAAKKAKRYRKLKAAKKAAAPKNKNWQPPAASSEASSVVVGEDEEEESRPDDSVPDISKPATPMTPEEEEREKRKQEKRAKRGARQAEKAARRAQEEKATAKVVINEDEGSENGEAEEVENGSEGEDVDPLEQAAERSMSDDARISPFEEERALEAFPLPRSAPLPSADVLARQGLPAGLENATFVDQDLRIPIDDLRIGQAGEEQHGLNDRMRKRLRDAGISDFFAVQAAILPQLLSLPLHPLQFEPLEDYLISAPTGSGKTLAYAVPIIELLSRRLATRLSALIVLPTKDLVVQVRETLEMLAKGTSLRIGAITGQHTFAHEQKVLVADLENRRLGGSSKVDILVATPGRLIDHLTHTSNFSLQHLRFLVIDEADRLLNQSFQNWLAKILSHIRPPKEPIPYDFPLLPDDHIAPHWHKACGLVDQYYNFLEPEFSKCQKLLFSATLTRDPAKVAALDLFDPQYYIVQSAAADQSAVNLGEQFALPSGLTEKMLILPAALKPLNLIHLIHDPAYSVSSALVFTKSVESTTRLVKLLEYFEAAYGGGKIVKSYTSEMKPSERKKLLADFSKGEIHLLVCSDLIARGMDLPTVEHVVSYDIPLDMRKYVHRVGRTARAGRSGTAWTLVEKQEALHFKNVLHAAGHLRDVKKVKVQEDALKPYKDSYELAMSRLKDFYAKEKPQ